MRQRGARAAGYEACASFCQRADGSSKEQTDAIKALEHAAGYIKHELVERLQLRRVPDLHFTLDLSQEHVERIEQLLKQMKADRAEKQEPGA